jgi:uncharacterized membrane protein (UPF0127 family)
MPLRWLGIVILALTACSRGPEAAPGERVVEVPGGARIVAEVMARPEDMARGMMYRDALPAGRGMLFIHSQPGRYPYWMHNVKIPLDIIWLDAQRRVVEISAQTPGCDQRPANECPSYGGRRPASFVLELAGGEAARLGIAEGTTLGF